MRVPAQAQATAPAATLFFIQSGKTKKAPALPMHSQYIKAKTGLTSIALGKEVKKGNKVLHPRG
jgi:hypothetical protein